MNISATKNWSILGVLIPPLVLGLWISLAPLDSAFNIGGDDGFELGKAYFLYEAPQAAGEIWNDQPWLHTLMVRWAFEVFGPHAMIPRLISYCSLLLLAVSLGSLIRGISGWLEQICMGLFLVSAGGMPILAAGAMLELPAIAVAVGAVAVAYGVGTKLSRWRSFVVGTLFGAAVQIKFTAVLVCPAFLVMVFVTEGWRRTIRYSAFGMAGFLSSIALIGLISPSFALETLVLSHIAAADVGSYAPGELSQFRSEYLLSNPALCIGTLVGLVLLCKRRTGALVFGGALLVIVSFVAVVHVPWWKYYLLHFYVPMSMLAGVGVGWIARSAGRADASDLVGAKDLEPKVRAGLARGSVWRLRGSGMLFSTGALIVSLWLGFTVPELISEVEMIYASRTRQDDPIIKAMQHYAPRSRWCYSGDPAYSFHGKVLMPPELLVLPLKRFATGAIDKEQILALLKRYRPEQLILDKEDELTEPRWAEWVGSNYVLVEQTDQYELWLSPALKPDPIATSDQRLRAFGL